MKQQKVRELRRERRRNHVRSKITGTLAKPRLCVYRSSKHIYAQLIDDMAGATVVAASSCGKELAKEMKSGANIPAAKAVGKKLAEAARAKGITVAAFDRGHYKFHGRVMALAQAATAAGLKCSGDPKPPKAKPAAEAKAEPKPKSKQKGEGKPKAESKEKGVPKAE